MRWGAVVYSLFLAGLVAYSVHLTRTGAWLDGPEDEPSLRNGSARAGGRGHRRSRSFFGK